MKFLKQIILPAAIMMIGAGAAFATSIAKNAETALITGYRYDPSATVKCIAAPMECTTADGPVCQWRDANNVNHTLYEFDSPLACGDELKRVTP